MAGDGAVDGQRSKEIGTMTTEILQIPVQIGEQNDGLLSSESCGFDTVDALYHPVSENCVLAAVKSQAFRTEQTCVTCQSFDLLT